jgi:hypothetical protein
LDASKLAADLLVCDGFEFITAGLMGVDLEQRSIGGQVKINIDMNTRIF